MIGQGGLTAQINYKGNLFLNDRDMRIDRNNIKNSAMLQKIVNKGKLINKQKIIINRYRNNNNSGSCVASVDGFNNFDIHQIPSAPPTVEIKIPK